MSRFFRIRVACTRVLVAVVAAVVVAFGIVGPFATSDAVASSSSIGAGLHGPSGLTAAVYAKGLQHLSALTADTQGHIWAATALATDTGTDAVYEITAAGAVPIAVISNLHTPLGLLWIGDSLYVSRKDGVDRYSGFDGSRFATVTTVVSFPDDVGELNGIVLGADGRIYLGISAPCDHCTPTSESSASVVSFLPDGSDLQVMARNVRAPVGLTVYPGTSDLFVTMNQRDDLGAKTPGDWLVQVSAGQDWKSPGCYGQSGTSCTGVPTPVATLDRHAAVSGVAIVTGQLGKAVGTAAVVAEWTTGKVRVVKLTKSGTTYTGKVVASITGFKNPMPVYLDATGALLVGDWTTGKIFRITA